MRRPAAIVVGAGAIIAAVIFAATPGGTDHELGCAAGQVGGVIVTPAHGAPGYPTPEEAAGEAEQDLSDYVDRLDVSAINSELFEASAPNLDALIHVHKLPSGGYLIESIDYCYMGPHLGPTQLDETKSRRGK